MTNKSKKIILEVSAGELLDKISILEIKLVKIKNPDSQQEINKEYKLLKEAQASNIKMSDKINLLFGEIKEVNIKLWNIEDKLRICEKNKDFFITVSFPYISKNATYLNNIAQ